MRNLTKSNERHKVGFVSLWLTLPMENFSKRASLRFVFVFLLAIILIGLIPISKSQAYLSSQFNLYIDISGSGTTDPSPGRHLYNLTETVIVTAQPNNGWRFTHWLLNGTEVSEDETYSIDMTANNRLTAVFTEILVSYILNIIIEGSGATIPVSGVNTYASGEVIDVSATADEGWRFVCWQVNGSTVSSDPSYSITMNDNFVLTALFIESSNIPPIATIVAIETISGSDVASEGEVIWFRGEGSDDDGYIIAYRWTSSIDGELSGLDEFSTSSLSVGTHTISFEVQDDSGDWSSSEMQSLVIEGTGSSEDFPYVTVLALTGAGVGGTAALLAFLFFDHKLHSTLRIKKKFNEEQKKKQEKDKKDEEEEKNKRESGKPYLHLKADFPPIVMGATKYDSNLEVTNIGLQQAKGICITSFCTPGLKFKESTGRIEGLLPLEKKPLVFPLEADEQIRKGVYKSRFEVSCKNALGRTQICNTRAVKIGLIAGSKSPESSMRLKEWLKGEKYFFNELKDALSLFGSLLNFDILIVGPDAEMPDKWIKNISSFVRNGQSVLVIDRVVTDKQRQLAELLGYDGMKYEFYESNQGLLHVNRNMILLDNTAKEKEVELGKCWGNSCISGLKDANVLANFILKNGQESNRFIPAITTHLYGKGKVAHLNFHAEEVLDEINDDFHRIFNWLLF